MSTQKTVDFEYLNPEKEPSENFKYKFTSFAIHVQLTYALNASLQPLNQVLRTEVRFTGLYGLASGVPASFLSMYL